MRFIKFRVWDSDCNTMVYPEQSRANHYKIHLNGSVSEYDTWLQNEELLLFIGLKDKNSKEVYEGDIIKCSAGCPHQIVFMTECPSTNLGGMPGFYLKGLNEGYAWTNKEEVIGNTYENPELLK